MEVFVELVCTIINTYLLFNHSLFPLSIAAFGILSSCRLGFLTCHPNLRASHDYLLVVTWLYGNGFQKSISVDKLLAHLLARTPSNR